MCGIAGIVDLRQQQPVCRRALARMAQSLLSRGPDEEGYFVQHSTGLAARRLSIVGIADGQQPMFNEDRSVVVVFNGELFDYPQQRESLIQRGHTLRSHTDTELLVHLWEDHQEDMFRHLRGQFAFALVDLSRKCLILARDRVGICPLHWSQQGDRLLFGSEIKALLASELVPKAADPKGLDNIFTFFCMPGRRTAFQGIQSVSPGRYLRIDFGTANTSPRVQEKTYWDFTFPDRGREESPSNPDALISSFDDSFSQAIRRRLRADVPVAAYLSGGVDSTLVVAKSRQVSDAPLSTFTARMTDSRLDESTIAERTAADFGCDYHVVNCDRRTLVEAYPKVVIAADCPVVDPNAGSLFALSRAVHQAGFKAVLTGEGADEALAGYVWFKVHRLLRAAGSTAEWAIEKFYHRQYPEVPRGEFRRINALVGGFHAHTLVYHLTSIPHWRLLRPEYRAAIGGETAWDQLEFDPQRIARWHPLNQSLYLTYKTHLPGLLLSHRGDRVAMANSVEARYPFLDEDVIDLCSRIHPRWKLRGLLQDKVLLRQTAGRILPKGLAMRRKAMFRAPFADTLLADSAPYLRQLLTSESLRRTDYFDAARVTEMLARLQAGNYPPHSRFFIEMALCAVVGTQLWHHLFLGGGLCELAQWHAPTVDAPAIAYD